MAISEVTLQQLAEMGKVNPMGAYQDAQMAMGEQDRKAKLSDMQMRTGEMNLEALARANSPEALDMQRRKDEAGLESIASQNKSREAQASLHDQQAKALRGEEKRLAKGDKALEQFKSKYSSEMKDPDINFRNINADNRKKLGEIYEAQVMLEGKLKSSKHPSYAEMATQNQYYKEQLNAYDTAVSKAASSGGKAKGIDTTEFNTAANNMTSSVITRWAAATEGTPKDMNKEDQVKLNATIQKLMTDLKIDASLFAGGKVPAEVSTRLMDELNNRFILDEDGVLTERPEPTGHKKHRLDAFWD